MFIQTESTPNPATFKFLPGTPVAPAGPVDFRDPDNTARSPLAQRLFRLQGVRGVFLGGDFVSVTKADDTDWAMLKPMVLAALMDHLSMGMPVLTGEAAPADHSDDDEISAQIRELILTRVRPMVMMDGGDIAFERFEDGIAYVRLRGACSGCPSATVTLKMGIENMLRHFVPEVMEVRSIQD